MRERDVSADTGAPRTTEARWCQEEVQPSCRAGSHAATGRSKPTRRRVSFPVLHRAVLHCAGLAGGASRLTGIADLFFAPVEPKGAAMVEADRNLHSTRSFSVWYRRVCMASCMTMLGVLGPVPDLALVRDTAARGEQNDGAWVDELRSVAHAQANTASQSGAKSGGAASGGGAVSGRSGSGSAGSSGNEAGSNATSGANATSGVNAGDAEGEGTEALPSDEASPAAQTGAAQTGAAQAPEDMSASTYSVKLRDLEQQVNQLKDRVFRSKTRLSLLAETVLHGVVAGAQAIITHSNDMSGSYRLTKVVYSLDGAPIFSRADEENGLEETREFDVYHGSIVPGDHTLTVNLEYRGHGYGVFSYVKGYKFKVGSSHTFTASEGKIMRLKVVGYERGGPTVAFEKRPAIRYVERSVESRTPQEARSTKEKK